MPSFWSQLSICCIAAPNIRGRQTIRGRTPALSQLLHRKVQRRAMSASGLGRASDHPLYKRALAIAQKALGPDHPSVAIVLDNLATLYRVQRDWARAAQYWRRSTGVIIRRTQRGTGSGAETLTRKGASEAQRLSYQFFNLIKMVYRGAVGERGGSESREMFETAQWALASEAATSLTQMAARGPKAIRPSQPVSASGRTL
jgi:hypothetical protein